MMKETTKDINTELKKERRHKERKRERTTNDRTK